MIAMARNVIDFLNKLKQENDAKEQTGKTPLLDTLNKAKPVDLDSIKKQVLFVSPKALRLPPPPDTQSISYRKPREQVLKARRTLKAVSWREVGERTFDYFYNAECKE